jgi:hypothetical protein
MFSITGTLRYSPKTLGERVSPKWWLVIDADPEIGRYFRHLHHLSVFRTKKLSRPAWAEHITVVRDEVPQQPQFWERYAGKSIDLIVTPLPETDGVYHWLPIQCGAALDIREELGLARDPLYPLHLSFGHEKETQ